MCFIVLKFNSRAPISWEVTPKTKWPDFYLKEVWAYRELLARFVRTDFLASHKQTVPGSLWILIQPLLTALTYVLVFKNVMGVSTSGRPGAGPLFRKRGHLELFSKSILTVPYTYSNHAAVFHKMYFPRITTSVSICLSPLVRLGIQPGIYLVTGTDMAEPVHYPDLTCSFPVRHPELPAHQVLQQGATDQDVIIRPPFAAILLYPLGGQSAPCRCSIPSKRKSY